MVIQKATAFGKFERLSGRIFMINRFKLIISEKIKVSGIRGCMAAGAVTAGIAALVVIGGINSDDISTVSLETDVIPEETAVSTAAETEKPVKRSYSHDIEYLSEEDIERIEAEAQKADEAETETEETVPAADDATEVAEEESSEEVTDAEAETSDEEASENEADEQTAEETAPETEEESSESVTVRSSAADGDDDGNGLSSALDLDVNNENESADSEEDIAVMSVEEETPIAVMAAPDAMEAPVEASDEADEDDSDIPEDITLDDETAPEEGAVSLLDLPEWLSFDENGVPTEYVNVLTGNACAYTADPDALMSTGKPVFQGYVAVDPDIIPYGSELYIVAEDGEVYGYAIAADTGYSVRKGHIIVDLFMNEYDDCIQWGNKPVNVYVLK